MNFWYAARDNEIFVDLDNPRALTRALSVLRRALRRKVGSLTPLESLLVESVWLYPSSSEGHFHLVIVLRRDMCFYKRVAWSLWLATDRIRAAYVLMRYMHTYGSRHEILVSKKPYGFRRHDALCQCEGKHKSKAVTDRCPALADLLGNHRSDDYFPRNRDQKRYPPARFQFGEIPISRLRGWRP